MTRYAITYGAAAAFFLTADFCWLGFIAPDLYRSQIGHLVAPDFKLGPAIAFYATYLGGLVYFAARPAISAGDWRRAILPGAILGLVAYGTYDFTNWAVMRDWPAAITFIDLAWGIVLTASAATAGAAAAIRWG